MSDKLGNRFVDRKSFYRFPSYLTPEPDSRAATCRLKPSILYKIERLALPRCFFEFSGHSMRKVCVRQASEVDLWIFYCIFYPL